MLCNNSAEDAVAYAGADLLLRRGADETITNDDRNTPEEMIESSTDTAGRLRRLLANAPVDRTWRRRGMLVLCRAYPEKRLGDVGNLRTAKISCQGQGVQASADGASTGAAVRRNGCRGVMARVVEIDAEPVFRIIVGFL